MPLAMHRPSVIKMAGCWVWMCSHLEPADEDEPPVTSIHSGRFTSAWRDPWTACMTEVLQHHAVHHSPDYQDC